MNSAEPLDGTIPGKRFSVCYSVTFTLLSKCYVDPAEKQWENTAEELLRMLSHTQHSTIVTELTQSFNIHYHATIELPLQEGFYAPKLLSDLFRKHKYFGNLYIKQIDDIEGWMTYIFKAVPETWMRIHRPPILKLSDYHHQYVPKEFWNHPNYFIGFQ